MDFSALKINFRSADAANHVNRDPGGEILVTRRAYLPRMCMLDRVIRRRWGASLNFAGLDQTWRSSRRIGRSQSLTGEMS